MQEVLGQCFIETHYSVDSVSTLCLIRAVHLELVECLDVEAFIRSF